MAMTSENLPPAIIGRLGVELKDLIKKPVDDITVTLSENDITDFTADIKGPADTPYEGGVFRMKIIFGAEFPQVPPKGVFITKIFHPNVSKTGEICVNTLKRDWKPNHTLKHVLTVIRCLLIAPYPESALNEEAGKLLLEDYNSYAKHAKLMTSIHAAPIKGKTTGKSELSDSKTGPNKAKKKKSTKAKSVNRL